MHKICWAYWSYLDLLWTVALLKEMTAVGLLRKQGGLGVVRLVEGRETAFTTASSLYHCQQPLSAASFSSLDPAFSFFCLLRTSVFSPLLPVLCSWTTSITRVSEFLARRAAFAACHSLQESLHWLYGRPTHSHAQNSRKDFLVGSQADRVVWLQCG